MKLGDIFYLVAIVVFSWVTFAIIRGNFRRKFDEQGRRKDLVDPDGKLEDRNEKNK
jgi:ribose 5-phosphate isomerase RpiB